MLSKRNQRVLMKFKVWHMRSYRPSLRLVANAMDINYNTLKSFSSGKPLGESNLDKVEIFLDQQLGKSNIKEREAVM